MEALQKISDEPLKDCPVCHKPELSKLISAASFRLKGGGWYETDFKTGGKKQLAESDSTTKSSGDDVKSDSRAAKVASNDKPVASGEKGKSSPEKGGKDQSGKPKKAD
jgi:putative FmdB family regulatory protein